MHDHNLATMELNRYLYILLSGTDPEISERGIRKPNSRKGGQNSTFQCSFQSFSYKSLSNIPPKGGGGGRPAPPQNPRLALLHVMSEFFSAFYFCVIDEMKYLFQLISFYQRTNNM